MTEEARKNFLAPPPDKSDAILHALAYPLGIVPIILLFVKQDSESRYHALNSIFFSLLYMFLGAVLGIVGFAFILSFGNGKMWNEMWIEVFNIGPGVPLPFLSVWFVMMFFNILYWVCVISMAIQAYQGKRPQIPWVSKFVASIVDDGK